jgi:hypothetical protein
VTPRKRAPGGGRKRSPNTPTAQLTVRLSVSLRSQLVSSAKKHGWTLTDELSWRLRSSFAREREEKRDPTTRALRYLITRIAETAYCHVHGRPWHRDPFTFKAFKLGVAKLLDIMTPEGEIVSPFEPGTIMHDTYETPQDAAEFAVTSIMAQLVRREPITEEERATILAGYKKSILEQVWPGIGEEAVSELERDKYLMADVQRDLDIQKIDRFRLWEKTRD